jgi:hypothetical protein
MNYGGVCIVVASPDLSSDHILSRIDAALESFPQFVRSWTEDQWQEFLASLGGKSINPCPMFLSYQKSLKVCRRRSDVCLPDGPHIQPSGPSAPFFCTIPSALSTLHSPFGSSTHTHTFSL